VKVINLLETARAEVMQTQVMLIHEIEDELTAVLQEAGLLEQDQEFDVRRHMNPLDPDPFGLGEQGYEALTGVQRE
jgi:hypothetical protein